MTTPQPAFPDGDDDPRCPTPEALGDFLAERLHAEGDRAIAAHLEVCGSCQARLNGFSPESFGPSLRKWLREQAPQESAGGLLDLKQRLYRLGDTDRTLSTPATEFGADAPSEGEGPKQIGRFVVQRKLGSGGFGVVLLADDPVLKRLAALKLPRNPAALDPAQRARFLREAQAAARLQHPHIVTVYEAGEADGFCYLAAAYCEGPDLAAWLERQAARLVPRIAAEIVAALAGAVEHAHQNGILHRDIKPSNVLLDPAGKTGEFPFTPKLSDFGLAKLLESDADATMTGQLLGTPRYMAPEQAEARREAIGPASDVYALGVVLYELITGRAPIVGGDNADTLRRVVCEHPPAPRKLAPRIPRDLEAICLKCLEKSPARRYPSAGALADDLRRFLSSEPTLARPLGRPAAAIRWARRQPLAAALASLIVLVAIVSPLAAVNQSLLAARESQAQQKAEQSSKQETRARQLAEQAAKRESAARGDAERKAGELAEQKRELRYVLYQSRLDLAHQAWRAGNMQRLVALLEQTRPGPQEEELRGFEWRYWWRRSHEYVWRAEGPAAEFGGVFSPDGRWLAVPDYNRIGLRIYDVRTSAVHKHLRIHNLHSNSLAFSPDGSLLAYSHIDHLGKQVVLWETASGQVRTVLQGGSFSSNVAFSPDGKSLATIDTHLGKELVRIWNIATRKSTLAWPIPDDTSALKSFGYSADGNSLISTNWRGTGPNTASGTERPVARVWDAATGEQRHVCTVPSANYRALLSPDRSKVAVHAGTSVRFWDCLSGKFDEASWEFMPNRRIIGYSPKGSLVTSDANGALHFLSCSTGEVLDEVKGHQGEPQSAVFSPDGRYWASFSDFPVREVLVWEAKRIRGYQAVQVRSVMPGTDFVRISASADAGFVLAASAADQVATLWDPATGAALETFERNGQTTLKRFSVQAAVAHDGAAIALADCQGKITVWKRGSPTTRQDFRWEEQSNLAFSPGGDFLVAAGGKIALWRLDPFQLEKTLAGHPLAILGPQLRRVGTDESRRSHINSIAFSPDGNSLASASEDSCIRLWDIAKGQCKHELVGHSLQVHGVAFSPNGKLVASASHDRTVKLWDADSGALLKTLQHTDNLNCLAFAPDGKTLAVGGVAPGIQLWNVPLGEPLTTLDEAQASVNSLAFTAGGQILAATTSDGKLHFWRAVADADLPPRQAEPVPSAQ